MLVVKATKEKPSVKMAVSATKVEGIVLHFAPKGHSLIYCSCIAHGNAQPVESPEERRYAIHLLINMVRKRWLSANPVMAEAMKTIQVIKDMIRSASAKPRVGNLMALQKVAGMYERGDVWMGVLPLYKVLGEPVLNEYGPEMEVQREIVEWKERRNKEEKAYAEGVAVQRMPVVKE